MAATLIDIKLIESKKFLLVLISHGGINTD